MQIFMHTKKSQINLINMTSVEYTHTHTHTHVLCILLAACSLYLLNLAFQATSVKVEKSP